MARKPRKKRPAKRNAPAPAPPVAVPPHGRTCRVFLILAAFLAGAAVMIIELAGNRILAPWFGNSLYTWTGLIGVILMSISAGYYLGGYLADRRPDYVVLSHLLAVSAFLTMLVPLVSSGLEKPIGSLDVVWGPVLATLLLFAMPGCLLASVSPFAIRLISLLSDDKSVGISAGSIGMVATMGSVIGTFGSGFLLIPHLRLKTVFLVTGLVLGLLALAGYVLFSSRLRANKGLAVGPVLLFAALAIVVAAMHGRSYETVVAGLLGTVKYEQNTFYHTIQVVDIPTSDGDTARFLKLDTTEEGSQYVGSDELVSRYQDYWQLARLFAPHLQRAAFLGGGAFTMPEALADAFPDAQIDVVEIDPAVIEVGRKYFRLDEYPRVSAVADDARRFLRLSPNRYDLIFGDAYHGARCVPAHLVTREFFALVKGRLNQGGVYVMNIAAAPEGDAAVLFRCVARTLSEVFEHQAVFCTFPDEPERVQNVFIVAASHDLELDAVRSRPGDEGRLADDLFTGYLPPDRYDLSDGVLFTDDRNPVEFLVARTLRAE
ncbi:MAG: fused MFS/spermidine synthase [Planctomycetes bacterium]|nr:fused MFS/spermidine synthase [Planctomycetota bacterium]